MPRPPTAAPPSTERRQVRQVRHARGRPAASSSSRGVVPSTATRARHPAARAARSPATASSTTTQSAGSTPSRRAPSQPRVGPRLAALDVGCRDDHRGVRQPGGGDAGLGEVARAGGDDGRRHPARRRARRAGRRHRAARRCRRRRPPRCRGSARTPRPAGPRGSSVCDDARGRHPVEAQQPHRVDPVLAAPPDPGPLDGGDGVDERAVEVEQHPRERRVERRLARRTSGWG